MSTPALHKSKIDIQGFTMNGDDGLSEKERAAYAKCVKLSCAHESCMYKYLYKNKPAEVKARLVENQHTLCIY